MQAKISAALKVIMDQTTEMLTEACIIFFFYIIDAAAHQTGCGQSYLSFYTLHAVCRASVVILDFYLPYSFLKTELFMIDSSRCAL